MRVTEHRLMEQAAAGVTSARDKAAKAAMQTQSGISVSRPSDNPSAWAEGVRASARHSMSEGRGASALRAHEDLVATDDAFSVIGDALSSLKALSVQMATGTISANERAGAVSVVAGLKATSLAFANVRSNSGEYLLAGNLGDKPAFDANGVYVGDTGQRSVEVGESGVSTSTLTGTALTAASGVDVFALFDTVQTALSTNNAGALQGSIVTITQAIEQVAKARTDTGNKMLVFETAEDARAQFEVRLAEVHNREVEADPIKAAAAFTDAQSNLQQAQRMAQQLVEMLRPR